MSPEDGLPPVRVDLSQIQRAILDLADARARRDARRRHDDRRDQARGADRSLRRAAHHGAAGRLRPAGDQRHRAQAWMQRCSCTSSSRSTPRARVRRAVSACPRCTASSARAAVTSGSTASPVTARRSRSICPKPRRGARTRAAAAGRSRCRAGGRRCCSSRTSRVCERSRQVLEGCGYTVVTASSGEEALERCRARRLEPDLLITDVVMPGITGSQLVAHLRATETACVCSTCRDSPKMRSSITAWRVESTSCRSPSRLPISRIKYEKSSV